jgi:MFS family permease
MSDAAGVSTDSSPRVGYREALESRELRALFAAQLASVAGTSIAAVALTVLVYRRTGSPLLAALVFALTFVPYLVGGAFLSGLVDRARPRRLVVACDSTCAVLAALMALPGAPVALLLGLLLVIGTLSSISSGARAALTRSSVPEDTYVPARSLLRIAAQTAQIGGNACGGALLIVFGTSAALLLNAVGFAFSALVIRLAVANHAGAGTRSAGTMLVSDSLRGARTVFSYPELRRLLLLGWLVPMFAVAPEALAAPYVTGHGGSSALVGWWLVALPVGLICGDIAGVRWLTARQQRRIVAPAAAAGFIPYLVFGWDPPIALALALLFFSGTTSLWSLGLDGRVRDAAPRALFARTMTLSTSGLMSLQGIGFALAGAIAQATGPANAIAIAGVCGLTATAILMWRELRPSGGGARPTAARPRSGPRASTACPRRRDGQRAER